MMVSNPTYERREKQKQNHKDRRPNQVQFISKKNFHKEKATKFEHKQSNKLFKIKASKQGGNHCLLRNPKNKGEPIVLNIYIYIYIKNK